MPEQLPLDFTASATQRHRRAVKAAELDVQPSLFSSWAPNIDVHLHSPSEAIAHIGGPDPERTQNWLSGLVGSVRPIKTRRVAFPSDKLDRLLHLRPPAQVTLDAAAAAVSRSLWAAKLELKPLHVRRERQRLLADSPRWPRGFRVKDAPWTAIATLVHQRLELNIDPDAQTLLRRKLEDAGAKIAVAGLAGSAVVIETSRPEIIESMGLPGLAYAGEHRTGMYKMPLLAAEPLLRQHVIDIPPELRKAIEKASAPVRPMRKRDFSPTFPYTLYGFQAQDAGRAVRILETTGGVLLAGDMGSGKTTVALALADHMDIFPLLVVAPLSAFSTWQRQLAEVGRTAYLATENPAKAWARIEAGTDDVVVISYDRLPAFVELIERVHFRGIVADEVQRIRTPGSKRSRALRALAASVPLRIGLSGTPLTNTVADLLPLGAFLAPGEWRPRANEKDLDDLYPGDPVEAIAEHLGSLMVRRRLDDTGAKLPPRHDHRVLVKLTSEQRRALEDLEAEAEAAKAAGEFDSPQGRFHAFAKLQKQRQIINSPAAAGVSGQNPKVISAIKLAQDFLAQGRKGVIFCADRTTFVDLGKALDREQVGWVGLWGSTPSADRIRNERAFHAGSPAPNGLRTDVVVATIQAGAEAWSASPTATWLISTAYMYAPATLAQMEARVHRLNSDLAGPDIEICYIHAQVPGGSLDDRMCEILAVKRELFAQVVDRRTHTDATTVHYSMGDLLYLLTGKRDVALDGAERDRAAVQEREQDAKLHARRSLYKHKRANADLVKDDGSQAKVQPDRPVVPFEADLDALVETSELDDTFDVTDPFELAASLELTSFDREDGDDPE